MPSCRQFLRRLEPWVPPWWFNSILLGLLAILFSVTGVPFDGVTHGPHGLCVHPPSQHVAGRDDLNVTFLDLHLTPSLCDFSEGYYEARAKFRKAAAAAGADLSRLSVVPGHDYTMDIAVVPGTGPGLTVHTSGVHGVEGYAGSAIQISALREMAKRSPECTTILVHAVNPYGMAHYRRFNEHNVDLNRNALDRDGWAEVLSRDPNLAGYDDFDSVFNPRHPPSWLYANLVLWLRMPLMLARFGLTHMKAAMVSGQYHIPSGIFYGGTQLEPSHALLTEFMQENGYLNMSVPITWIDVHTGLGQSGKDTLLLPRSAQYSRDHVHSVFPEAESVQGMVASGDGDDVSAGYQLTRGTQDGYYALLSSGSKPIFAVQEFGTVSPMVVARAMVLENMAFHHDAVKQPVWAEYTRDAFYVRTREWKQQVLKRGLAVLFRSIRRSAELAKE